jgi:hypothetical protein
MIEALTKERRRDFFTTLPELVSCGGKNGRRSGKNREGIAQTYGHDQAKPGAKAGQSNPPCAHTFEPLPVVSYLLYFSRIGVTSLTRASESCEILVTWLVFSAVVMWFGLPPVVMWLGLPAVVT